VGDHIADRLVHTEATAGERAVAESGRIDNRRVPGHGVGHQCDALGAFRLERQCDRRRMHVNEIGDQAHGEAVVGEDRAQQARLAMVQRPHAVEAVGGHPGAGRGRSTRVLLRRGGVAD
jgi:hypothetical protein